MRGAWIIALVHLVWQLVMCLFFGGSFAFVVLALVILGVVDVIQQRRSRAA